MSSRCCTMCAANEASASACRGGESATRVTIAPAQKARPAWRGASRRRTAGSADTFNCTQKRPTPPSRERGRQSGRGRRKEEIQLGGWGRRPTGALCPLSGIPRATASVISHSSCSRERELFGRDRHLSPNGHVARGGNAMRGLGWSIRGGAAAAVVALSTAASARASRRIG